MPIAGSGWEFFIARAREDRRDDKRRTVGNYQVYRDGEPVDGLSGMCAESPGPGDNSHPGNGRCVEKGRYPLLTQDGEHFKTIDYSPIADPAVDPQPGMLLGDTGHRVAILIHPGFDFLYSIGCINLAESLPDADADMDFFDSRPRVIAAIDDLRDYLGEAFPERNGQSIPNASVVIDDAP
jgi:hypothetical protein